jgi:hypothetical protein
MMHAAAEFRHPFPYRGIGPTPGRQPLPTFTLPSSWTCRLETVGVEAMVITAALALECRVTLVSASVTMR